eukprot:scaffold1414_cov384-Prasinococcus_capsulatus_cf.AAC.8
MQGVRCNVAAETWTDIQQALSQSGIKHYPDSFLASHDCMGVRIAGLDVAQPEECDGSRHLREKHSLKLLLYELPHLVDAIR